MWTSKRGWNLPGLTYPIRSTFKGVIYGEFTAYKLGADEVANLLPKGDSRIIFHLYDMLRRPSDTPEISLENIDHAFHNGELPCTTYNPIHLKGIRYFREIEGAANYWRNCGFPAVRFIRQNINWPFNEIIYTTK